MTKYLLFLLLYIGSMSISTCQTKPQNQKQAITIRMKKYDWLPTECAPVNYPIQIYRGTLFYGDQKSIYIPDGVKIKNGWGNEGSLHVGGETYKEAPHTLNLSWRSFAEKKDYTGTFTLNTTLIDALFSKGFINENVASKHGTYQMIQVGMAPGGIIVVWLKGVDHQVEVGRYQAKETKDLNWKIVLPDMIMTMDQYGETVIKELPHAIQLQIAQNKIPYGKWDNWRKRYKWKPELSGTAIFSDITIYFFNKEIDDIVGKQVKTIGFEERAAPETIDVFWRDRKNQAMRTQIDFNEKEIYRLLNDIKANEEAQLIVNIGKNKEQITVKFKTLSNEFPLVKLKVNTYELF